MPSTDAPTHRPAPPHGVVVDVRALQADAHASRGIGRYTLELIRAVEAEDPTLVRAYVADPGFPMHEQLRELLGTGKLCRGDDPALVASPPRVVHVTSPFVEGNADGAGAPVRILAAWARHRDTRLMATVYDLIPARFPEVYLHDPAVAAEYRARTWFLRGCDRLLSISQATSDDLVELLGVPAERIETVHGAAGEQFVPPRPGAGPPAGARRGRGSCCARAVPSGARTWTGCSWRGPGSIP